MPGNVNRNHRNMRNNPYTFDDLAARLHRTAAGVAWRWRTELAILTLTSAALWRLAHLITSPWAGAAVGLALIVLTRPAVDPAPVLVRASPPPGAKTVLGSPPPHQSRQAATGLVDPADQGRRTPV